MISVDEAKKMLESKYKDISADVAYEYGDKYYLFLAPTNGNMNEPYYLVDKFSGKARYMNPLEDFDLFIDSTENHQIKSYRGEGGDRFV